MTLKAFRLHTVPDTDWRIDLRFVMHLITRTYERGLLESAMVHIFGNVENDQSAVNPEPIGGFCDTTVTHAASVERDRQPRCWQKVASAVDDFCRQ